MFTVIPAFTFTEYTILITSTLSLKLREAGHKNSKIELMPNYEVSKNFVFILKKDGMNYLLISTFNQSCFKIDPNG